MRGRMHPITCRGCFHPLDHRLRQHGRPRGPVPKEQRGTAVPSASAALTRLRRAVSPVRPRPYRLFSALFQQVCRFGDAEPATARGFGGTGSPARPPGPGGASAHIVKIADALRAARVAICPWAPSDRPCWEWWISRFATLRVTPRAPRSLPTEAQRASDSPNSTGFRTARQDGALAVRGRTSQHTPGHSGDALSVRQEPRTSWMFHALCAGRSASGRQPGIPLRRFPGVKPGGHRRPKSKRGPGGT